MTEKAASQTDGARFRAFVDEAIAEISRRDGGYLSLFPIDLPDPRNFREAEGTSAHRYGGLAPHDIERIFEEGNSYLSSRYKTIARNSHTFLAEWVGSALIDAHQAARGMLPPAAVPERPLRAADDVFGADYDARSTPQGTGYYIRKNGDFPVVLINATGLPIGAWERLLGDETHGYRLIVPRRPHGDLFAGGIRNDVRLESEAGEIISIIESEGLERVHILAWCNGARLAVEVAALLGNKAASLTFLSPMFKGIDGIRPSLTPYQRDLQMILDLVARDPKTATAFARKMSDTAAPTDWSRISVEDTKKLEDIFKLPSQRQIERLLTPLLSPDSLINVARRVTADETHPTVERLSALDLPMMVVMGSHDVIVSNQATIDALQKAGCESAKFLVLGAGHDIHDLQYHYLRYALSHFVDRQQPPPPTARMRALI